MRLALVTDLASRQQIGAAGPLREYLLASGIKDADLRDGSVGVGRVYCCGADETVSFMMFYVPQGLGIEVGDVVEVKMGRNPSKDDRGAVTTAARVRQKRDDASGPCRWDPPTPPGLWMKVLYCDWMKQEGWVEERGPHHTWMKPASSTR